MIFDDNACRTILTGVHMRSVVRVFETPVLDWEIRKREKTDVCALPDLFWNLSAKVGCGKVEYGTFECGKVECEKVEFANVKYGKLWCAKVGYMKAWFVERYRI